MTNEQFNPGLYMVNLKGKAYLPALPRIQWLRTEHPDWSIKTKVSKYVRPNLETKEAGYAIVRATIKNEKGQIVSTAVKFQSSATFADYLEKAETGAISRACAFAGYGTLMAADVEEEGSVSEEKYHAEKYGSTVPK